MKNLLKIQLIVCLCLVHSGLFAIDNYNKFRNMFYTIKGVDKTVSTDSRNMATIFYNDTLFNFINYHSGGKTKIILRKIYQSGQVPNLDFDYKQIELDLVPPLATSYWQPAPVVFRDSLLLFAACADGHVKYFVNVIDSAKHSQNWSMGHDAGNTNNFITGHGMTAVVLDDKLCLITHVGTQSIRINWTEDLKKWHYVTTPYNIDNSSSTSDQLSAVVSSTKIDSAERGKLVIAWLSDESYLTGKQKAWTAEYYFSNDSTLTELGYKQCIYDSVKCSSVALAVGTISCPDGCPPGCQADPTSTHECVQAFLKNAVMENGYNCYRILRVQRQDTVHQWRLIESNLLPQNAPDVLWASKYLPLNPVVLPIPASDTTIRQFMCLVYQGVKGSNYPLNIAVAETNKLIYVKSKEITEELTESIFQHYVGYIEGPPPYSHNHFPSYAYAGGGGSISELVFQTANSTVNDQKMGFNVAFNSKNKLAWVNINIGGKFGKSNQDTKTYQAITTVSIQPQAINQGYTFYCSPTVTRQRYHVVDVQNNVFNTTYYLWISDANVYYYTENLKPPLVTSNPPTYLSSQRPFDPSYWSLNGGILATAKMEWVTATPKTALIQEVTSNSITTSAQAYLTLGFNLGGLIKNTENLFTGTFDWSSTVTVSKSYTITACTRLNSSLDTLNPPKTGDYKCLKYNAYWIKSLNDNDWWIPEKAQGQHPWCITYQVVSFDTVGGDTICNVPPPGSNGIGESESSDKFWLSQNYPNPFSGTTTIEYRIGNNYSQYRTSGMKIPTKLFVTSMTGNLVETLVDEFKTPGSYTVNWNTSKMEPGVYFYTLQAGNYRNVKKLILLK